MTVAPIEPGSAPAFLVLQGLSESEEATRLRLIGQLSRVQRKNLRQQSFYEGSKRVRDLGISIPPHLRDVECVAAWPEIVVDVIDERMEWRGWDSDADLGLGSVFDENHLGLEVNQAKLDSLMCGLGFLSVGTGDDGEPDLLVKAESPMLMTATLSPRLRRATEALREVYDDRGRLTGWTLYDLNQTVRTERRQGRVVVVDRDEHDRNRIPVAALVNRPRSSRVTGRSEITRAVRSLTESAMRTLLGMEVAREFYGAPQRYLMGAEEDMFVDENGQLKSGWETVIGRLLVAPRDEDGELPVPGQFSAASPQPFTEVLKTLAQMMSAATGIPATHLGFNTDNPSSEGAIIRADRRLDQRAGRRESGYDIGLVELGALCGLWRDGDLPAQGALRSLWVDRNAPSPNAQADRAVKMISAGALDPTWDFTLEQFGLSDDDIRRVTRERRRSTGSAALRAIADAAAAGTTLPGIVDGGSDDNAG